MDKLAVQLRVQEERKRLASVTLTNKIVVSRLELCFVYAHVCLCMCIKSPLVGETASTVKCQFSSQVLTRQGESIFENWKYIDHVQVQNTINRLMI